jgi:glycosyltransferase involved in cell wall biosynthesis
MKVSIITAVRNGAANMTATLVSVRRQTYPHIEHIVIDGASTDGTLDVVAREGAHVACLRSEPDSGVYQAFNRGLKQATGDVVAFLNAGDTYFSQDIIASVVRHYERPGVSALCGDVAITAGVGGRIVRQYKSSAFSPRRIAWGFMPAHPTLFIRREIYERFGPYDETYRIAGDFEFVARVFGRGAIACDYMPRVLAFMPTGGLSSSGWRSWATITREMRRACQVNGISTNYSRLLMRLPIKYISQVLVGGR